MSDNVIPLHSNIPHDQYVAQWRAEQLAAIAKSNGVEVLDVSRIDKHDELNSYVAFTADNYKKFLRDVLEFIEREASL